jgi:hypothetical protein
MKIEIYVVTTENPDKTKLDAVKVELCGKFNGLTVIKDCDGLWLDNGKLTQDNVQIWTIVSSTVITAGEIMEYAEKLKAICHQKVQLVTVNGQPYFV